MKITVVAVGRMKEKGGFREMEKFYRDRLAPFAKLDIVELREGRNVAEETARITERIPSGAFVVALREKGKSFDSARFSAFLGDCRDAGRDVVFAIGGAYGFGEVGEHLALSIAPWTLNHLLARLVLLEQIYRGFSLLAGRPYHHD